MKRLSVGWQDDQATIVFEDPARELRFAELDALFRGSRYRVVDLVRVPPEPVPSAGETAPQR